MTRTLGLTKIGKETTPRSGVLSVARSTSSAQPLIGVFEIAPAVGGQPRASLSRGAVCPTGLLQSKRALTRSCGESAPKHANFIRLCYQLAILKSDSFGSDQTIFSSLIPV